MSHLFHYKNFTLHYLVFGTGINTMFAIHGFGQNANVFQALEPSLGEKFTTYSINIFFHEKSAFPKERIDSQPLTKKEWTELFSAFADHLNAPTFSLMGYSMGGRLCLNLMELIPDRVKSFTLMASDGLKIYPLSYYGPRSKLLQKIFLRVVENPSIVFAGLKGAKKLGIMNKKSYEFFNFQLSDKTNRQRVYDAHMVLYLLIPDLKKIKEKIIQFNIPTFLIFGKYDTIIIPQVGERFAHNLPQAKYIEIEAGHNIVNQKLNKVFETIKDEMV